MYIEGTNDTFLGNLHTNIQVLNHVWRNAFFLISGKEYNENARIQIFFIIAKNNHSLKVKRQ